MSSQQQIMVSSMSNLSLSNDMSQHTDDLDDEQSRPNSPKFSLSLTIHERHQTDSNQAIDNKVGLNDHISSMTTKVDEKTENLSEWQNERSQSRSYEEREKNDSNNLAIEEHHTEESGNASGESTQVQIMVSSMDKLSLPNDFIKSPLRSKSVDIDTMAQHSDDKSRPNCPQLPL
ncbi:uncharacterized protein LOC133327127 [Musca vetustissima]|uniref:uncharacterized protein LOC133327126 n=1 Tax=Musca vetustissima TaxID=27455 RepID=UPI002AB7B1CF|nr:uncharacterized protein LOC133327126 [Musca vetustissima]XP_061391686.1 uncharacterized protein LOC133327127 [Musca vetustissima]